MKSSKFKRRLLCREAPKFWWQAFPTLWVYGLWPLSCLFRFFAWLKRALDKPASQAPCPVFSIGNLVVGGAGKTPLTLWLINFLKEKGLEPRVVTRGYGGRLKGPLAVNPQHHTFEDVGDEALLLAKCAHVYLASPRSQALPLLQDLPPTTVLLLDDAHQHGSLKKEVSLVVVDGKQGFGNGFLLPAGPLREPIQEGLSKACAVVVMGAPSPGLLEILQQRAPKLPLLRAWMKPITNLPLDAKIFGFAGIGFPEKFKHTLEQLQGELVGFESFPDHHPYTARDMEELANEAFQCDATLVTTAKDWVRIPKHFQEHVHVIDIEVAMEQASQRQLEILLEPHLKGREKESQ
ncbi:MAG: tetraacyldisaccharide 4'-kinase [Alphaproteobacteria bacterium]